MSKYLTAGQARFNAGLFVVSKQAILDKVLSEIDSLSREGWSLAVFPLPSEKLSIEDLDFVLKELTRRGFEANLNSLWEIEILRVDWKIAS